MRVSSAGISTPTSLASVARIFLLFGSSLSTLSPSAAPCPLAWGWLIQVADEPDGDRSRWTGVGFCAASDVERMFEPAIEPISVGYGFCIGGDVELDDVDDAHESPQFIDGGKRSRALPIGNLIPRDIEAQSLKTLGHLLLGEASPIAHHSDGSGDVAPRTSNGTSLRLWRLRVGLPAKQAGPGTALGHCRTNYRWLTDADADHSPHTEPHNISDNPWIRGGAPVDGRQLERWNVTFQGSPLPVIGE